MAGKKEELGRLLWAHADLLIQQGRVDEAEAQIAKMEKEGVGPR